MIGKRCVHRRQIERYRREGKASAVEEELKRLEEAKTKGWEDLRHHAQFLAKRGVNIVRWHGHLPAQLGREEAKADKQAKLGDIDEEALDQAFHLVATMKDAGIYAILSPYWGSHTKIEPGWKLPDPQNDNLSALVFFVPEVQAAYHGSLSHPGVWRGTSAHPQDRGRGLCQQRDPEEGHSAGPQRPAPADDSRHAPAGLDHRHPAARRAVPRVDALSTKLVRSG
jgi:hypothetical protein